MYPVQTAYLAEPAPDYVRKAAEVVWNIHLQVSTPAFANLPSVLTLFDPSKEMETSLFSLQAEKRSIAV